MEMGCRHDCQFHKNTKVMYQGLSYCIVRGGVGSKKVVRPYDAHFWEHSDMLCIRRYVYSLKIYKQKSQWNPKLVKIRINSENNIITIVKYCNSKQ